MSLAPDICKDGVVVLLASLRSIAPVSVRLPLEVTVPDKVKPCTVPIPETLLTVPPVTHLIELPTGPALNN